MKINNNNNKFKDITSMDFEEAYKELEGIVESLEKEEISLETSMNLFERGKTLSNYCKDLLIKAELRIKDVNGNEIN